MYDDNAILACQSHANVLNSKRILKSEVQAAFSPLISSSSDEARAQVGKCTVVMPGHLYTVTECAPTASPIDVSWTVRRRSSKSHKSYLIIHAGL